MNLYHTLLLRALQILLGCVATLALQGTARGQAGSLDNSFADPNVSDGFVACVAVDTTGRMIISGSFTMVGGTTHNHIARLNSSGVVDGTFTTDVNGNVSTVCLQTDGKILIGGTFTMVNGAGRKNIARLNNDGSLDTAYDPNASSSVFAIVLQADGKAVVSGNFFGMGGVAGVNGFTRLNTDGAMDPTFTNGQQPTQAVGVVLQTDGKILTAGQNQTPVGRLLTNGMRDTAFNTANTCVARACVAVQADGKILTYTEFDATGALLRRFNVDGTADASFSAPILRNSGPMGSIASIYVQADGNIVVGGTFTTAGFDTRRGMARFSPTGALDPTFNPNVEGTGSPSIFAMGSPDGKLMLCGVFTTVGGTPRNNLARINLEIGTQTLKVPDAGTVTLLRSGAIAEAQDVVFELSTDGGSIWNALGAASRMAGGWRLAGLSLPPNGTVRARCRIAGSVSGRCSTFGSLSQLYSLPDNGTVTLHPAPPVTAAKALTAEFENWTDAQMPLTYEILVDGVSQGAPILNSNVAFTGPSTNGPHTLTGRIYDATGAMTAVSQTFEVDTVAPQLAPVHLASSNANAGWARPGNTATVTFQASEGIGAPTVRINGVLVLATALGENNWKATLPVNANTPEGSMTVSIQYADIAGNAGVTVTATTDGSGVTVDKTPPMVALIGAATVNVEAGSSYVEPGATGQDARAGDVSGSLVITGNVNTNIPGNYSLTYTVRDLAGNTASTGRTVVVMDTTAPGIAAPAGGFLPLTLAAGSQGTANLPDYTGQPVTSDLVGVTSVTQAPLAGTAFPPGEVGVTLTAHDAAGNTKSTSFSVTVVDITDPAIEAPGGGFLPATITTGVDATAPLPDYTAQAVTSDNVAVTNVTQNPAPGSARPAGVTMVTLTAHDAAGNMTDLIFAVTVADGTKPEIAAPAGGFTPLEITAGADGTAALGDYTAQAVTSDNVGVTSVTQVPPPGDTRLFGRTVVTLTAHDAADNARSISFEVVVRLDGPVIEALVSVGAGVGGAGVDPRIPADAKFSKVGIPAVGDHRVLAFLGKWKSSSGAESGIFAGDPAELLVKLGEDAPGLNGAKIKTLQDPLLAPDGSVAFRATVKGLGIKPANDEGVWMSSGGVHSLVLRESAQIPGLPTRFKLKSVAGLSLRNGELLATARLALAAGLITTANDSVLLRVTPSSATILAREGDLVDLADGFPASAIKEIKALIPATGSPAHGRWQGDGVAVAQLTLANQRSVILGFAADGSVTRSLAAGDGVLNLPASAVWNVLHYPAIEPGGQGAVVRGTLIALSVPGLPPVLTTQNDVILAFSPNAGTGFSMFARESSPAPGAGNAVFASFLDPLVNDASRVAFSATLAGAGITPANNTGIWWGAPDALELLARTNSPVPGADGVLTAARWSRFVSLALPSGPDAGPVFTARVRGAGVTPNNDLGLWGVDSTGRLRQLLRTGDLIAGQAVIGIQSLSSVPAALGMSRGFNARGTVAARVLFAHGGQALVRIDIPEGTTRLGD